MMLVVTHLLAFAMGLVISGAYARREIAKREAAAEFLGMRARIIAHSPEEAARLAEGL